jgi:hypothetical protein
MVYFVLALTYCVALCAAIACWKNWRRAMNKIAIRAGVRRVLVGAYWLLTFTMLVDVLASLIISGEELTQIQFKILLAVAVGLMPQIVLFALVITPVAMRGKYREYSFIRALMFIEGCAVIAIIMLAVALINILRCQEILNVATF